MSYTARHGRYARLYLDVSAAGTFSAGTTAAGTANLVWLEGLRSADLDESRDFVETTSFGDLSKTQVAGLPANSMDAAGVWNAAGWGTMIYNALSSTTERAFMYFPDYTDDVTTWLYGKVFVSRKTSGAVDTAVTSEFHFEPGPTGLTWAHP